MKYWVRFPNEEDFTELELDLKKFEKTAEFAGEIFGWYDKKTYICIKK